MNRCEWCGDPTRRRVGRWVPLRREDGKREIRRVLVCDPCFHHNRYCGALPGQVFAVEDADPEYVTARLARGEVAS